LSINENSLLLHPSSVQVFHERGIRPVIDVTTRLGRRLRCTPDHPLLTEKGWREAGRLTCGARIASARALPYFGQEAMSPEAIKLIAYILSDGSPQSAIDVTRALPGVEADLKAIADAFETGPPPGRRSPISSNHTAFASHGPRASACRPQFSGCLAKPWWCS